MTDYSELVKVLRETATFTKFDDLLSKREQKLESLAFDAAAAIEELQAKISELGESYSANLVAAQNAQPHWVSVEQPPKKHMWCFVYTDEPDMIMPIRIAFYTASCTGKGSWYHYESGSDITDEVDYWTEMLLEGPKLDHDLPWPIEPPKEDA